MDFSFTEEQQAVGDLARQILTDQVTHERLKEVEAGQEGIDRRTWAELAKANLLGVALPEDVGGSGLGFLAACVLLYEVGRAVAPVPVLASVVMASLPIAEWGTASQKERLLPGAIAGDRILTAALVEEGTDARHPTTTAIGDSLGWRLDGTKVCVPAGPLASHFLVPAQTGEDTVGVFLVAVDAPGVSVVPEMTTSRQPEARVSLDGVVVPGGDVLGDPREGRPIVEWIVERATAAICTTTAGVCEQAVRMTAEYTKTREQFDRPIASFQAVGQRAADAYIDAEAVRLTAWQAAWRLDVGMPAAAEVAVAKFWAADGGQRVVHAAQHLHGGIGVDRDYPLHRYFLWAKHLELTLGGATSQLLSLGALLAAEPV
ncbi:MAG TPA: acyl-CoA dehydrogenase family protein [Acidimicrobiales bacterium]|nr:acyl-CoA dehydrogenase family protein [Acidimicrobiales bacterium]